MCSLRDSVQEYVQALEDTDKKIKECPPEVGTAVSLSVLLIAICE